MKINKSISCFLSLLITGYSFAQPQLVGTLPYSGPQAGGSVFRLNLPGNTPGLIYTFNNLAPHRPTAVVCAGNGDWLYGVLSFNGTNENGGLYKIQRDGAGFTMLYNFTGNSLVIPYYHTDGFIYFTDAYVIKKLNPADNSVTDVGNGGFVKSLHIDANNWIYFTNGFAIQKMKTDGTGFTDMYTFNGLTDGFNGYAGLTETPGDSLFGVQAYGGTSDGGTLYSIKKDGTGFTVHHQFANATGIYPDSKLVYFDGKLYGTTTQGGNNDVGVLYTINPDGSGYRALFHFDPGTPAIGQPFGDISIAANGRIFGTFYQHYYSGGTPYKLYKIDTSGANFEPFLNVSSYNQREYGHLNQGILLADNDESIFLVTQEMGRYEGGVLSKFDTLGTPFASPYHFGYSTNGFRPLSGVIKGSDGKLYGTAKIGGTDGAGVIYSINADGTSYTKLHEFTDAEGYDLEGKLLEASDGKLYGASTINTTASGSIYRMNKNGTGFEIIYSFTNPANGYQPEGNLKEDNSGSLYGVTNYSTPGRGIIFKMNKDGSGYTAIKTFDGAGIYYPTGGVTISGDYLYGVCRHGGADNKGAVYRIKKDGTGYEELHVFTGATDGSYSLAAPIIASNGKLYGTASQGGNNSVGIIYSMDITGTNYTILKHFSDTTDGAYPSAGLVQASDGLLYGVTFYCYISGLFGGTVYRLNLDGSGFTVLKVFDQDAEGQGAFFSLVDLQTISLPVQWLTFNAEKKEKSVLLTWQTAQEQNSDRFEIERSTNGTVFTSIGTVAAAGNTSIVTDYSFTDYHPLNGSNFYRLKQIDIDGQFSYSKIAAVDFGSIARISLFPNPASGTLNARWRNENSYTSFRILDAAGKLIMQKSIPASSSSVEIDIHQLIKGWYVLQLTGKEMEQKTFIKE